MLFIYSDRKFSRNSYRNYSYDSYAMSASSSSVVHDMPRKNVIHHMPRRNVVHVPRKQVMNLLQFFMLAMLPLQFVERIRK